jgi:hypothetical protein
VAVAVLRDEVGSGDVPLEDNRIGAGLPGLELGARMPGGRVAGVRLDVHARGPGSARHRGRLFGARGDDDVTDLVGALLQRELEDERRRVCVLVVRPGALDAGHLVVVAREIVGRGSSLGHQARDHDEQAEHHQGIADRPLSHLRSSSVVPGRESSIEESAL